MKTRTLFTGLLVFLVFVSAMGIVQAKHDSRKLFVRLQKLEHQRDEMIVEWGRLQLEEATWAASSRIDNVARSQLKMFIPPPETIVYVRKP